MKILENPDLTPYSSMGVRARGERLYIPENEEELQEAIRDARKAGKRVLVLGGGTNVVFGSGFIEGYIISTLRLRGAIEKNGKVVCTPSGLATKEIILFTKEASLSGLEVLWGIPGTIGGAVVGNAGTKDGNVASSVLWVKIIDMYGREAVLDRKEIRFWYRGSSLKGKGVVTKIGFQLREDEKSTIENRIKKIAMQRRGQPRAGTAGSVFKNPPGMYAGKILENLGFKGLKVGGAMFSRVHANFIVCEKGTSPEDVLKLIELAKKKAMLEGIKLEEEVDIWR